MIFPEDVILQRVNLPVYEVIDHCGRKYYTTDEQSARYASCTHVHCCECGKPVKKPKYRCDECSMKSVPEWDGEYPIFIGDQFFENEDDLGEWLEDQEITKEELQAEKKLYTAHPNMASKIDVCYEDLLAEDQELPEDIQECIDKFKRELAEFKKPISWYAVKHVKFTRKQIETLFSPERN